jgi:hypothetical protein
MRRARQIVRTKIETERLLRRNEEKESRRYQAELWQAARPNLQKSIASINASIDLRWLRDFHARMKLAGESEIVMVIDNRLKELEEINFRKSVAGSSVGLKLADRVQESLRVYEALASRERGRTFRASRTRQMITRYGERETVRRVVTNQETSNGLETLARYDRLDLSYEQIILDFHGEFDVGLRAKARENLARLSEQAQQTRTAR